MNVDSLKLINYRNHKKLELNLSNKTNLIVGQNGAGKTNILEALNVLSTTKSYRARYDKDLIMYNEAFTKISAKVKNDIDTTDIDLTISKAENGSNRTAKKYKINQTPKALYLAPQVLSTVLFSPEDINFVTGAPNLRRKYVNMTLWQTDMTYKKYILAYTKALQQRNKLLEIINEQKIGYDQLPYWNSKILEFGEYIQQKREEYVSFINKNMEKLINEQKNLTKTITYEYIANPVNIQRLTDYKDKEVAAKTTLIGPHRDDFVIYQEGRILSEFGSRGEQRTAIFLIKVSEIEYFKNKTGQKPVLLLDDILSELDLRHQKLTFEMTTSQQTIISSTDQKEFIGFAVDNIIKI